MIWAEGIAVESFYPGPVALRRLDWLQRLQLMAVLPGLLEDPCGAYGALAHPEWTRRERLELGAPPRPDFALRA